MNSPSLSKFSLLLLQLLLFLPLSVMAASADLDTKAAAELVNRAVEKMVVSCAVPAEPDPVYSGQLLSIDVPGQVEPGQLFQVRAMVKNTGNMPWISSVSGCPGQSMTYLGTSRTQDRQSLFHAPAVFGNTGWYTANRIKMKTPRVEPGKTAEFEFVAHAPADAGIYREYFSPLVEGVTWIGNSAEFKFDVRVGNPSEEQKILKYTRDILMSINLTDPQFQGDKKIVIDLSEQNMYLQLGGVTIKKFTVSTGKRSTPTPVGVTSIQFKQDVRVAASRPHYIMPLFMQFRRGGYGIHALPSLANDRGVYWREALNHIGTPRSHGCVRLLPEDATFAYEFADVGTPVHVVW